MRAILRTFIKVIVLNLFYLQAFGGGIGLKEKPVKSDGKDTYIFTNDLISDPGVLTYCSSLIKIPDKLFIHLSTLRNSSTVYELEEPMYLSLFVKGQLFWTSTESIVNLPSSGYRCIDCQPTDKDCDEINNFEGENVFSSIFELNSTRLENLIITSYGNCQNTNLKVSFIVTNDIGEPYETSEPIWDCLGAPRIDFLMCNQTCDDSTTGYGLITSGNDSENDGEKEGDNNEDQEGRGRSLKTKFQKSVINFNPNPFTDFINFKADSELENILIRDISGKIVFQEQKHRLVISTSSWKPGIYIITYSNGIEIVSEKLVKL